MNMFRQGTLGTFPTIQKKQAITKPKNVEQQNTQKRVGPHQFGPPSPWLSLPPTPSPKTPTVPRTTAPGSNPAGLNTDPPSREVLTLSMENIYSYCQNQEVQIQQLQGQLDASVLELNQLKASMETSSIEMQQLRNVNRKLSSSKHTKNDVLEVDRLFEEVKDEVTRTAKMLSEVERERHTWLTTFEEMKRIEYDKRAEYLQQDFQRAIESKETEIAHLNSTIEQLLDQLQKMSSERDQFNQQLLETKADLDRITQEKMRVDQEREQVEKERTELKLSFNATLNDRIASSIEALSEEKSRSQNYLQELDDYRSRAATLLEQNQKITEELDQMKLKEESQKKEWVTHQIATLREENQCLVAETHQKESELVVARQQLASQIGIISTCEDIKNALAAVSKERSSLQKRLTSVEDELKAARDKLKESESIQKQLELSVQDWNRKYQNELHMKTEYQKQVSELVQQLTASNQSLLEMSKNKEDLVVKVSTNEDGIRKLQLLLDDSESKFNEVHAREQRCHQINTQLEKEVGELKNQLMGCNMQLQYKDKRLDELQEALRGMSSDRELIQSEAEMPKPDSQTELERLKKSLNKQSIRMESLENDLKDALEKASVYEAEAAELRQKVILQEQSLKFLQKETEQSSEVHSRKKTTSEMESRGDKASITFRAPVSFANADVKQQKKPAANDYNSVNDETRALILLANAKADQVRGATNTPQTTSAPSSASPVIQLRQPSGKKDRNDFSCSPEIIAVAHGGNGVAKKLSRTRHSRPGRTIEPADLVPPSPVIRNKSGVSTTRTTTNRPRI